MELVKQHQQDLRTATQFWHGARRVLTVGNVSTSDRLVSATETVVKVMFVKRRKPPADWQGPQPLFLKSDYQSFCRSVDT